MKIISHFILSALIPIISLTAFSQTGSENEPVRYIAGTAIDPSVHEGRLRYAIGTENIQVLRANRTHPEEADGYGWTYNHAPNLAWWNGQFYLQYLSNPEDEHVAPGHTLLVTSKDGRHWGKPVEVFPPYQTPEGVEIPEGYKGYMMHQRMGFYIAPNGRLLVLGFYGHTDHPFGKGGIGRVVREVYKDGSYSPVYFIRYSSYTDFNETNTSYPFYKTSEDKGFVEACTALLNDRLKTLQWQDEDYGADDFYPQKNIPDSVEAFSYFHRKDGKVVGLWKFSYAAISEDEGATFSTPRKMPTLLMAGGKNWGQKTDDGRYAMVYNPIEMQEYRFPLALISSDDGIVFDDMLLVQGEVPPRRFFGRWKDFGPCYVRGITEGNGNPPGKEMWLTYSMNKEDIWISHVPLPIRYAVKDDIDDDFDNLKPGGPVTDWNIYAPKWAGSEITEISEENNALQLSDKDPYDYARAIRVFREGQEVSIKFKLLAKQNDTGMLDIEVADRYGNRPVRIRFNEKEELTALDGNRWTVVAPYRANQWYDIELAIEATPHGNYTLTIDKKKVLDKARLAEAVKSVERLSLRTGKYRTTPTRSTPNQKKSSPLPGADEMIREAIYQIDDVRIE